jgi:colanic acid/amylovoran biosynthesis glycosyltransferase
MDTILIFRTHLLRLSETFIQAQAEALKTFKPIYVGLQKVEGLDIPEQRRVILTGGGRLRNRLERARAWLLGVPRRRIEHLRNYSPVLVHAHFGIDAVLASRLSKQLGIPLVVTFHGYDVTYSDAAFREGRLEDRVYLARRRRALGRVSRFICVSKFIQRCAVGLGFPEERTQVHYIGINTRLFTPDPSIERRPIVLFVGRLVAKKGCEYLIRAMQIVQSRLPDAQLVVIGEGPLRPALEGLARELSVKSTFLGGQRADIVQIWMNQARVFCAPSNVAPNGDAEGFGLVFIEAQSMGLPVVSFASGGVPEAVEHGVTGLLAPERDWNTLASSIIELLENSSMWQRFSTAAQQRVHRSFDLEKQTAVLEQIYRSVLAENKTQTSTSSAVGVS